MTNLTNTTTSELFDLTCAALIAGRLSDARPALDELSRRDDNCDEIAPALAAGIPEAWRQLIQDRIDLVNAKADQNRN